MEKIKFNKKEVLERLHYLDTRLDHELEEEPTTRENFLRLIKEVRKELKIMSIGQLRNKQKQIDEEGDKWRTRMENQYCKKIDLDPKLCCVDDYHIGNMDGVEVSQGMPLEKVFNKSNIEMNKRIGSAKRNLDLSWSLDPVVVRPYGEGNLFEVIAGNHRVMAAISLMSTTIPVLCFCNGDDNGIVEDFII